ncbi:TPA: DUF106 domain-containing protein [Candidatus Woesearchaeota archaeon]|nr:MAG: hypothetical protein QT07_C0004G0004 [archaeon GW2011_AR16]HIG96358.1 DUF106 domain-containing protein [Candidatus Woesearchaeota archaeon]HIH46816.1 DUF106 domain-containing protein [Candidatus Woesearchaeota archaeon]HII89297.1 DUF106 domain-containing protein [Candidatus Woesearchaeota archaeon]
MGFLQSLGAWVNVVLDPLLSPLLKLGPFWVVLILSFVIAFFINLITKLFTNQEEMKNLKDELKKVQQQVKEVGNDAEKRMELQKKAMDKNFAYLKHSLRSTFITIIPLLILFGWMQLHLGFVPLHIDQPFTTSLAFAEGITGSVSIDAPNLELIPSTANGTVAQEKEKLVVDGKASWALRGKPGDYVLSYKFMNKTYTNEVSIKEQGESGYKIPNTLVRDGIIKSIDVQLEKIVVLEVFGLKLSWFWAYIIFSIVFSLVLKKLMKVY